jgi:hypothetical protein
MVTAVAPRGVYPVSPDVEAESAVNVSVNVTALLGFAANGLFALLTSGSHVIVIGFVTCVGALMPNDKRVVDEGCTFDVKVGAAPVWTAVHVAPPTPLVNTATFVSIWRLPLLYALIGVKTNVIFVGTSPSTC